MKTLIASLFAAFLLTACGGSESSPSSSSSQNTPSPTSTSAQNPATAPKAIKPLTPAQRGAKIYARCRACHTLEDGGRHKVGPNLWAVYGAKSASKEGYAYSKAMKAANLTWDAETMDAYLKKPAAYMPGNKMTFIGLKKQEDRDAVQAFLKEKTSP